MDYATLSDDDLLKQYYWLASRLQHEEIAPQVITGELPEKDPELPGNFDLCYKEVMRRGLIKNR